VTERCAAISDAVLALFPCVESCRRIREAAALRKAAAIAASSARVVDPLQRILHAALTVLPADHLVLLRASTYRMECVIVAAVGTASVWRGLRVPLGRGIAARAIETGEAQISQAAADPDASTELVARWGLVVPVILHGRVFGVLATADERRRLTPRHVTLLRKLAEQCALAINNARADSGIGS
jgi:GAF domain-containing protein